MKHPLIILFIFFCMNANICKSQIFVEKGKTWVYLLANEYPDDSPHNDLCYRIGNDTLISGNIYAIINRSLGCNDDYSSIHGFIRETEDSLVYFRSINDNSEYLYYDFGINIGDSVNIDTRYYYLDSVGISDLGRKIYYMSCSGWNVEQWIEGVGTDIGVTRDVITGGAQIFTCCLLDNMELYHSPAFEDCYYVTTSEVIKQQKQLIKVISNPDGSIALYSNDDAQIEGRLHIFSLEGKLLNTVSLSGKSAVEVCPKGNGILLYRFVNQKGELQQGKFLVP